MALPGHQGPRAGNDLGRRPAFPIWECPRLNHSEKVSRGVVILLDNNVDPQL
jgi:hypothetical protein